MWCFLARGFESHSYSEEESGCPKTNPDAFLVILGSIKKKYWYLVSPQGDGDFGRGVHGQVVGVPHQPEAAGVDHVVRLVLEPDQRRGDGRGL